MPITPDHTPGEAPAEQYSAIHARVKGSGAQLVEFSRDNNLRRRRGRNEGMYATNEVQEALNGFRNGEKRSIAHYDFILRMGATIVTLAFFAFLGLVFYLWIDNMRLQAKVLARPAYLKDTDGATYRIKVDKAAGSEAYIKDQIDEFCRFQLTALYTYTPEAQSYIALCTDSVDPVIITDMETKYKNRQKIILSSQEIRSVVIDAVTLAKYEPLQHYAFAKAVGRIIYNNNSVSTAVPCEWLLLIQLQPEIQTGPNVYGLYLKRKDEKPEIKGPEEAGTN